MSHFTKVKTEFKDIDCLLDALMECGKWTKEQIEVHDTATNLYGYQGDKRDQKANIIIRRKYVGGSSNDLGFVKQSDGTYTAIISEYDSSKYSKSWMDNVTQRYGVNVIKGQCKSYGYSWEEKYNSKTQEVELYVTTS